MGPPPGWLHWCSGEREEGERRRVGEGRVWILRGGGRRKEEERGTERKREDEERSRKNVKEERRGVGFSCSI